MRRILHIIPIVIVLAFVSCSENSSEISYNPNVQSAKDHIFAEDLFIEVMDMIFLGVNNDSVISGEPVMIDVCNVSYNGLSNTMFFDFGSYYVEGYDSKIRKGSFKAIFDGQLNQPGVSGLVYFDSLKVEEMSISGEARFEFLEDDEDMNPKYRFFVNNGMIIIPDTIKPPVLRYNCDLTVTWAEGASTTEFLDDVLFITGSASGINRDDISYNVTITDSLVNALSCWYIVSGLGALNVPTSEIATGTIDYIENDGNEGCNPRVEFYFGDNLFYDYYQTY